MTGGVIGLFILNWRMTILVLLFIPIKYVVMKKICKATKKVMDDFINDSQKYARWFGDTIGGVREVKLFGILNYKHAEFSQKQSKVVERQKKLNILSQWNNIIDTTLVQILVTVIYIIGANLVFKFQLSVGSVFAFITYSAYVTGPISAILNIGYLLSGIIPSTKRYYEFMNLQEETDKGKLIKPEFGNLKLEEVFSYETDKPILTDVNIEIPKGSKTVLIGKNGSGKSTIINLLTRMYEPTAGQIKLKGVNIFEITLESYRNMISVVSQQIYLLMIQSAITYVFIKSK